jgi:hypothetical protein
MGAARLDRPGPAGARDALTGGGWYGKVVCVPETTVARQAATAEGP